MVSTAGGFLLGFGLCLLLVSLLAGFIASAVYEELKERESAIALLYSVTHSSGYQDVISALDTLSGVAYRIRDALCNPVISWMGLCSYGEELANTVTNASNCMREVQHISEKALLHLCSNAYGYTVPVDSITNRISNDRSRHSTHN
jgi:hypothetical protein